MVMKSRLYAPRFFESCSTDDEDDDELKMGDLTEILKNIQNGIKTNNVKKLFNWTEKLPNFKKSRFDFQRYCTALSKSEYNIFKQTNPIILACKHNSLKALDFLFENKFDIIRKLLPFWEEVLPNTEYSDHKNAFYYAFRDSNCKMFKKLLQNWSADSQNYWMRVWLDEAISKSYQLAIVQNFPLTDSFKILVENALIDLRFVSSVYGTIPKYELNLDKVKDRLEFLLQCLEPFLIYKRKEIDEIFLFLGKELAKQIFTLKSVLKGTYDRVPWEEIEFFLYIFLEYRKSDNLYSFYYRYVLSKPKLFTYLELFQSLIEELLKTITNKDLNWKSTDKLGERGIKIDELSKNNQSFKDFYDDYNKIRDVYSLTIIENSVVSLIDRKRFNNFIVRATQIIGENVKNTWTSPNFSNRMLSEFDKFFRADTINVLRNLRDQISKVDFLEQRQKSCDIKHDLSEPKFELVIIGSHASQILLKIYCRTLDEIQDENLTTSELEEIFNYQGVKINVDDLIENSQTLMIFIMRHLYLNVYTEIDDSNEFNILLQEFLTKKINAVSNCLRKMSDFILRKDKKLSADNVFINKSEYFQTKFKFMELLANQEKEFLPVFQVITENVLSATQNKGNLVRQKFMRILDVLSVLFGSKAQNIFHARDLDLILTSEKIKKQKLPKNKKNYLLTKSIIKINEKDSFHECQHCRSYDIKKKSRNIYSVLGMRNYNSRDISKFEMAILDILELWGDSLEENSFFLDEPFPILVGKQLRNHLAHGNHVMKFLSYDYKLLIMTIRNELTKAQVQNDDKRKYKFSDYKKTSRKILRAIFLPRANFFNFLKSGNPKEAIKIFESGSIELNSRDFNGNSILQLCAASKNRRNFNYFVRFFNFKQITWTNNDGQNFFHTACHHDEWKFIEIVLKKHPLLEHQLNSIDNFGRTAIHYAVLGGSIDVVRNLVPMCPENMEITDEDDFTPIQLSIVHNRTNIFEYLLRFEEENNKSLENDVEENSREKGISYLQLAAAYNRPDVIKTLIKFNYDINCQNIGGLSAMHFACANGSFDAVHVLIKNGAHLNLKTDDGKSPLDFAKEDQNSAMVSFLLENGADGDPLIYAVYCDDFSLVSKILSENEINLNSVNKMGQTALHIAAKGSNVQIFKMLVENKFSLDSLDKHFQTPINIAVAEQRHEVVNFLAERKFKFDSKDLKLAVTTNNVEILKVVLENFSDDLNSVCPFEELLFDCIEEGNVTIFQMLLKVCVNLNLYSRYQMTLSDYACRFSRLDMLTLLLENGAVIPKLECISRGSVEVLELIIRKGFDSTREENGKSLLTLAVERNNRPIFDFLMAKDFDVNAGNPKPIVQAFELFRYDFIQALVDCGTTNFTVKGMKGRTLLHLAAAWCPLDMIKKLIPKYDSVNTKDADGNLPLHFAAMYGNFAVVRHLTNLTNEKDAQGSDNLTPLHLAVHGRFPRIVKVLIKAKVKTNLLSKYGTPLMIAMKCDDSACVDLLLPKQSSDDVNIRDENGRTALFFAKCYGFFDELIQKEANIQLEDHDGNKSIHFHIIRKTGMSNRCCLIGFYSINELNRDGQTLLHLAIKHKNIEVVDVLLDWKKCDLNLKNKFGQTPMHLAAKNSDIKTLGRLLNAGTSLETVDNFGKTVYDYATEENKKLLNAVKSAFETVKSGNSSTFQNSIEDIPINTKDGNGLTLLHHATQLEVIENVKFLIEKKIDVNAVDFFGNTALHYAAKNNNVDILRLLLLNGTFYNSENLGGKTPRDMTICKKVKEIFETVESLFNPENAQIFKNVESDLLSVYNSNGENIFDIKFKAGKETFNEFCTYFVNTNSELISILQEKDKFIKLELLTSFQSKFKQTLSNNKIFLLYLECHRINCSFENNQMNFQYDIQKDYFYQFIPRRKKYFNSDERKFVEFGEEFKKEFEYENNETSLNILNKMNELCLKGQFRSIETKKRFQNFVSLNKFCVLTRTKDFKEALSEIEKIKDRGNNFVKMMHKYGNFHLLIERGNFEDAIVVLQEIFNESIYKKFFIPEVRTSIYVLEVILLARQKNYYDCIIINEIVQTYLNCQYMYK